MQDIDHILERAQVVRHAEDGEKSSSFSKASFISADNSSSVDIDDPDFWKKAVGLTELEKEEVGVVLLLLCCVFLSIYK